MVLDTSAVVAILLSEPEASDMLRAIAASALVWRSPLWTLNVHDFRDVPGLDLVE